MTDFKTLCDQLLGDFSRQNIKKNIIQPTVCDTFGITGKTFRSRFKSLYGDTLTNICYTREVPEKSLLTKLILESETTTELWEKVNIPKHRRAKIFQEVFGVSTFKRAKALCLSYSEPVPYNPTLEDNKSIAISQVLGDGAWLGERGSFSIQHGEKQGDYLFMKASLFNKAWPTTKPAGNIKKHVHKQGHIYYSWYSGRLPQALATFLSEASPESLVDGLTPLGVMLFLMDDACLDLDTIKPGNSYMQLYIHEERVLHCFRKMLKEYGINTTVVGRNVCIKDLENTVKLYKNFIEPFKHLLPECLKYKTELKI